MSLPDPVAALARTPAAPPRSLPIVMEPGTRQQLLSRPTRSYLRAGLTSSPRTGTTSDPPGSPLPTTRHDLASAADQGRIRPAKGRGISLLESTRAWGFASMSRCRSSTSVSYRQAGIHPDASTVTIDLVWRVIRLDPGLRRGDAVVGARMKPIAGAHQRHVALIPFQS